MLKIKDIKDIVYNEGVFKNIDIFSISDYKLKRIINIFIEHFRNKSNYKNTIDIPLGWGKHSDPLRKRIKNKKLEVVSDRIFNNLNSEFRLQLKYSSTRGAYYYCSNRVYKAGSRDIIDWVVMPIPDRFFSSLLYYKTLFHEYTHSSSSKYRLNISFKSSDEEELFAEISSCIIMTLCGKDVWCYILSYMSSWLFTGDDTFGFSKRRWSMLERKIYKSLKVMLS